MAPKTASSTVYKLTYINAKGLGEPIRFLLAYGEVDYEDNRVHKTPELLAGTPFGRVPVLEVDGRQIHQCLAICRFLAAEFKLYGDNDWEALQVDIVVDTINDLKSQSIEFIKLALFGGDETLKEAKKHVLMNETLPYYLPKFEEIVQANAGHFVNGKLTWADIFWTTSADSLEGLLGEHVLKDYPNLSALREKVLSLPAIQTWVENRPKSIV